MRLLLLLLCLPATVLAQDLRVLSGGAAIVLPFIVAYTVIAYRIFGGKARAGLYD